MNVENNNETIIHTMFFDDTNCPGLDLPNAWQRASHETKYYNATRQRRTS